MNSNKNMRNKPIGVFDSGIGGLTVVKELRRMLPGEDIVYLGDTARVPYGTKSVNTIMRFAFEDAQFLIDRGVKLIVVACNTASSVALDALKDKFKEMPTFGVVEPGVQSAVKTGKKNIGIIGTIATVKSQKHYNRLQELGKYNVHSKACPLFVPLAEEGLVEGKIAEDITAFYLNEFKKNVDVIILGCTHYPLLKKTIHKIVGERIVLVDPSYEVAKAVSRYLKKNDLCSTRQRGRLFLYLTDLPPAYTTLIQMFLGETPDKIENVKLKEVGFC